MKIIHLSDLHFGTEDNSVVESLQTAIYTQKPAFVIVSGDFTQIGSTAEFEKAQAFLNSLPCPFLAVPGNHDVPAWDLWERFTDPYKKYRRFIDADLNPVSKHDNVLVAGINSARRAVPHWNWANGAVSSTQRQNLPQTFDGFEGWRVCTLHHPIHKVQDMPIDVTVFGRKRTLQCFQDLKIDLVLTGHVHHASITTLGNQEHQTVYLSASTALSSRVRGQENGFNIITLSGNTMSIEILAFKNGDFETIKRLEHIRTAS